MISNWEQEEKVCLFLGKVHFVRGVMHLHLGGGGG